MSASPASAAPNPEDVLKHLDWVRGLAERLVQDPAEAEDLRQEVWLLSQRLRRPQRMPLKGWLGGLLRNVVRDRRRAAKTRVFHEEGAALARAASMEEPAAVREVSLHQVVVERLLQLREPYRSTLLACYFEDLSHAAIAEREGVALATVRSRIQRGLAELRGDLGESRRGGASVLVLLAHSIWEPESYEPLGADPPSAGAPTSGLAGWGLGILTVGAAVWFARSQPEPEVSPPPLDTAALGVREDTGPGASSTRELDSPAEARVALGGEDEPTTDGEDPSARLPADAAAVRVVDVAAQPVAGVEVAFMRVKAEGGLERMPAAVTDADGRAVVTGVSGRGMIGCGSAAHKQLAYPNAGQDALSGPELVVVLAPLGEVRGRVVSPGGDPVAGARIRLSYRAPMPASVARFVDRASWPNLLATAGEDGRFSVSVGVTSVPMEIDVQRPGLKRYVDGLTAEADAPPLEIVLGSIEDPALLHGRVVSDVGDPVPGAWIADGTRAVRAWPDGTFQLGPVAPGATLWAGAPGFAPRTVPRAQDLRGVEIELSGEPLRIQGRVVDPDGAPLAGIDLRIASAEAAGDYFFPTGGRLAFAPVDVETFGRPLRGSAPQTLAARTGEDGAFVVEGLLPRDYVLEVMDPAGLARVDTAPIPAGATGVEVELPGRLEPVLGSVRTPGGDPLGSVLVRTRPAGLELRQGPLTRTGDDGSFRFEGLVPGTRVLVEAGFPWVHLGSVVTEERRLDVVVEPAARLEVVLDLRDTEGTGSFAGAERAPTSLRLRDASAEEVPFVVDDARAYRAEVLPLRAGADGFARPLSLLAPVRARELVFLDGDDPLLVVPLQLVAGETLNVTE